MINLDVIYQTWSIWQNLQQHCSQQTTQQGCMTTCCNLGVNVGSFCIKTLGSILVTQWPAVGDPVGLNQDKQSSQAVQLITAWMSLDLMLGTSVNTWDMTTNSLHMKREMDKSCYNKGNFPINIHNRLPIAHWWWWVMGHLLWLQSMTYVYDEHQTVFYRGWAMGTFLHVCM